MKSKTLYTTGQFAKINHINKRTLHYYDEVGLFSPKIVGKNGYRYYTIVQNLQLNTIKLMRQLGMSIEEIKELKLSNDRYKLEHLIARQIDKMDETIENAMRSKNYLVEKLEQIQNSRNITSSKIEIVDLPASHIITSGPITGRYDDDDFNVYQEFTRKLDNKLSYVGSIGVILPVEDVISHNFSAYKNFYLRTVEEHPEFPHMLRPKGKYLRAYVVGSWEKTGQFYNEILDFAREHHLTFEGYAYEENINGIIVKTVDSHINEISIKIKE